MLWFPVISLWCIILYLISLTNIISQNVNLSKDGESMKTIRIDRINITSVVQGKEKQGFMENALLVPLSCENHVGKLDSRNLYNEGIGKLQGALYLLKMANRRPYYVKSTGTVSGIKHKMFFWQLCDDKTDTLPFSGTRWREESSLELVHTDVFEQCNGKQYFFTFTDDFTHMV